MISVKMERTLQISAYEPLKFEIQLAASDYPGLENYPADRQQDFLHYKGYERMLQFQVFHNVITADAARAEICRIIRFYGLIEMRKEMQGNGQPKPLENAC